MNSINTMFFGGSVTARLILLASALVATAIAGMILSAPETFYAGYGIDVSENATLANELKAPAGMLLVAGLIMFAGVLRTRYTAASLMTAAAVYLSYGLARVSSIVIDGLPHSGMIGAAGVELIIGTVCLLCLLRIRRNDGRRSASAKTAGNDSVKANMSIDEAVA